ncbi:MAG: asparagine--tRNA ligase [Bacteriovoracaceae bacterium]|nr:asparagine--tRNA ligase [Bacteriovoracaceae bacterium]
MLQTSQSKNSIKEIFATPEKYEQKEIILNGWVKSVRNSKTCSFVMLSDGSTMTDMQLVFDQSLAQYEHFAKMLTGQALSATGVLVKSQGGKQQLEMQVASAKLYGEIPADYPLQKKATSLEFLRDVAHVRAKTNTIGAVFRVRHALAFATHEFFHKNGYYYANTPIITSSDCEGAGELFCVSTLDPKKGPVDYSKDYFGVQTYLAVSGQLEGEALALGMGKVYTFGPTFRSENSHTARHLSEFWMIEPEVAFADLDDVALLAQDYIQYLLTTILRDCAQELAFFEQHYQKDLVSKLKHVAETPFKKITYTEAVDILLKCGKKFEYKVAWGSDLQSEHERYLTDEHFKSPVIVTHYPEELKSFYMKVSPDPKTVNAMDVLVPGVGELIGGSQREDDYEVLVSRMKKKGLNPADYEWYTDLRRFSSVPHAGFGLGFERMVMYATGMSNIRDVIPFPRFPGSAKF